MGEYAVALKENPENRQLLLEVLRRRYEEDRTTQKGGYGVKVATTFARAALKTPMAWAKMAGAIEDLTPEQELFRQQLEQVRQGADPIIKSLPEDTPWYSPKRLDPERVSLQVAGMVPYMASTVAAYTSGKGIAKTLGAGKKLTKLGGVLGMSGAQAPAMQQDTYSQMLAEGYDAKTATVTSWISAPIEASLEGILGNPFTGPAGKALKGTAFQMARQKALQIAKRFGANFVWEDIEEVAQGAQREMFIQFAAIADDNVEFKGVGNAIRESLKEGIKQGVEAGPALAVMMGAGGGLAAVSKKVAEGGTVSRKEGEQLGLTPEEMKSKATRTKAVKQKATEAQVTEPEETQRAEVPVEDVPEPIRPVEPAPGAPLEPGEGELGTPAVQEPGPEAEVTPEIDAVEPKGRKGVTGGKSGVVAPPSYPKGKKFQRYHERYRKALKANDADTLAKLDEENGDWATLVVGEWFGPLSGDEIGNALDVFDAASDPQATSDVSKHAPAFSSLQLRRGPAATSKGTLIRDAIQIAGVEVEEQGQGTFTRLIRTLQERYDRPITVEQVGSSKLQALLDRHSFVEIDRANNTWAIDEHKGEDAPPDVEQPPPAPEMTPEATQPPAAPTSPQAPIVEPRPGEGESEYLERMLGPPGSEQRRAGDPAAVEHYRNLWRAQQRQPIPEPSASEPTTTGTKFAKTDELREEAGLGERLKGEKETFEQWEAEAARRIAADPAYPARLAERLTRNQEPADKIENAALGQYISDLNNRRKAGEEVLGELLVAVEASDAGGAEAGRALVARKVERYEDFSLAGIISQHSNTVNESPSREQASRYAEMADRIEALEGELSESQKKTAQAEVSQAIAEAAAKKKAPGSRSRTRGTKRDQLQRKASEAVGSFKEAWAEVIRAGGGTLPTAMGLNPEMIAAMGKVAKAAAGVVRAYAELGVDSFLEFSARVRSDLGEISDDQTRAFREAWNEAKRRGEIESPLGDNPEASEIGAQARNLMQWAVEFGIEGREAVVDAVHEELLLSVPEITRSETMQAMSEYGEFRELAKDEVSVKVRGYRGEIQQLLKLEDMQAGRAPKKTGGERREPTENERQLIKEVNEAKKRGGYAVTDPARQLKSAMGTAKTAISNSIKDANLAIEALNKSIEQRIRLVKPEQRTSLEADKELTSLREQLAVQRRKRKQLRAAYDKIFPPKRSSLSDAQRLKMAKNVLDRQISALETDRDAGRLEPEPKDKAAPVTDPELEAKKETLAELRQARDEAREASPEYQSQEEARQTVRYKKSLKKRLAFWEARRDKAKKGILPKKRKPTPVDDEIREQKWEIEQVKREARAAIEAAKWESLAPGEKGLARAVNLLDFSTLIRTAFEMSGVLRQGFVYTVGYPRQAFPSIVKSAQAFASRASDFAHHDTLMDRDNRLDYEEGINLTVADGPFAEREELMRSNLATWLANTEGWALAVPRWVAEGALASERAFRTFLNTMAADMYDNMKADVQANRAWEKDDVKFFGDVANTLRGRPSIPHADALRHVLWAPRWVWSGVQMATTLPFRTFARGVDLTKPSTVWTGDAATRLAVGKVYVRGTIGAATYYMLMHTIYSALAGDDDEFKPKYETDPRSSKFGRRQVGEVTFETARGLTQLATLGARLYTGETKTSKGEIVPIRGEGSRPGAPDVRDVLHQFLDYKLANLPSGVLDFMAGETAVGEQLPANPVLRAGRVIGERFTPMTWWDIWEAERELNVPQGTTAALEAFFGASVSTYGPRTRYRNAKPKEQEKLLSKYIKNMTWEDGLPAYSEFLSKEDIQKVYAQQGKVRQLVVYGASGAKPGVLKDYEDDESYRAAVSRYDKAQERFQEFRPIYAPTIDDAQRMLAEYWVRPKWNKEKGGTVKGRIRIKGKLNPLYQARKIAIGKLYSQD